MISDVQIIGLKTLPDVVPGVDLASLIAAAAGAEGLSFAAGDILIVTQKIVSKAEGRLVDLRSVVPSPFAEHLGKIQDRAPQLTEVVLRETRRVVKMDQGILITETHHGLVCANAGVDESNVAGAETVALLPSDPDQSARAIRDGLRTLTGLDLPVIISDTFGRPWREGLVNVAIGVSGLQPLRDHRGQTDTEGRMLKATVLAVADELASAAELVMGKLDKVPVAVVRGYAYTPGEGSASELVRARDKDLFR